MLDQAVKNRLRDPAYLDLHLAAVKSLRHVGQVAWYDSNFLRRFEAAKHYLAMVRPDRLDEFVSGFEPIRPPADFRTLMIEDLFDQATRAKVVEASRSAVRDETGRQTRAELKNFGRHVVWDHPFFLELQRQVLPQVSELVGRELESGYNFLSLYGGEGRCGLHMDEPLSMYTLDYCIEQSDEWPIWFSRVVEWPTLELMRDWDPQVIRNDDRLEFESRTLRPNEALIFNGSSQWHYRDPITPGGFCSLLFFHYFPKGTEDLVAPEKWASRFALPELEPLCDLFRADGRDGFD